MSEEQFYDDEIAPRLLEVAKLCEMHGFSMVAIVEFEPGSTGSTFNLAEDRTTSIDLVYLAAQARGNLDSLVFACDRMAGEDENHGNSIMLHLLRNTGEVAA